VSIHGYPIGRRPRIVIIAARAVARAMRTDTR